MDELSEFLQALRTMEGVNDGDVAELEALVRGEVLPATSRSWALRVSAETLGPSHDFFSAAVWERIGHNGCVTADDAKSWYVDFSGKRKCGPNSVSLLGYGDLALTFGFSHSTPNNSLPILGYGSAEWQPILER